MDEKDFTKKVRSQVADGLYRIVNAYGDRGGEFSLTEEEWSAILKNSNGICFNCKQFVGIENLSIDHVIPLSAGGDHSASNVVPACLKCNKARPKPKMKGSYEPVGIPIAFRPTAADAAIITAIKADAARPGLTVSDADALRIALYAWQENQRLRAHLTDIATNANSAEYGHWANRKAQKALEGE